MFIDIYVNPSYPYGPNSQRKTSNLHPTTRLQAQWWCLVNCLLPVHTLSLWASFWWFPSVADHTLVCSTAFFTFFWGIYWVGWNVPTYYLVILQNKDLIYSTLPIMQRSFLWRIEPEQLPCLKRTRHCITTARESVWYVFQWTISQDTCNSIDSLLLSE